MKSIKKHNAMNVLPEWDISSVITKYKLLHNRGRAKAFGQHFLTDKNLLQKIASAALPFENCAILEIGPGPCGLTDAIYSLCGDSKLICIEKDNNLEQLHSDFMQDRNNIEFIYDDATNISIPKLTSNNVIVVANLPYNAGTAILMHLLKFRKQIKRLVLMLQHEVAQRIAANVGTKEYGRLSVLVQLVCKTELLFNVHASAFTPPPKVLSTVIRLTPYRIDIDLQDVDSIVSRCFTHRRKMINKHVPRNILQKCCIQPSQRPETITPDQFLQLAQLCKFSDFI